MTSYFDRYLTNSRVSSSHSPPIGSQSNPPNPEPKPKRAESSPCSSSPSSDDEEEEEEVSLETVQADFGFFDPKPKDFGGVKLLLQNYLDDRPWDLSGFVDLMLEQTTVGSVFEEAYDGVDDDEGENKDDGGESMSASFGSVVS